MAVRIEEFVAYLGWQVDDDDLEAFNRQVDDTISYFAKVGAAIVGATAALTAFTVATNKETAQQANLAESVGITTETLEALSGVARSLGLDTDNVIDLMEEMNNKFGEMKGLGELITLQEGVQLLGLRYKELKDLEPEQQFLKILDAAKNLEDQQQAVSGVDMIFGGEANKILGAIRQIDGSLEDFIEKRKQLNLLTDEAVDQAKQFNLLWGGTVTVLKTAKASFAAFLGEALSPTLEEFLNWVRANRELIKLKIAEWAEKVGRFLEIVFRALKWGVFVLERVIDAFGGLENILAAVAGLVIGIGLVKMIRLFQTLIPIVLAAARAFTLLQLAALGKWALIIGLIALVGLAINSLVRWFQGRDSLIGDIGAKIAEQLDIWIQALADFFGFSKEEFDFWLVNFVDSVASAFGMAWDHIAEFFANLQRMDWQDVTDVWGFIWAGFIDGLTAKWASFITWFSSTVPGLTSVANTMWGVMRKIPGLQSFLPTISPGEMVSNASKIVSQAQTQQRPSAAAQRAVASAQAIRNTVNNVQSSRGGMGPITMNITQNDGESGEALGRRIVDGVREEFATAVRDNDTGVVY